MSRSPHRRVYVFSGSVLAVLVVGAGVGATVVDRNGRRAEGGAVHEGVTAVEVRQDCGGEVTLQAADPGGTAVAVAWSDRWTFGQPEHEARSSDGRLVVTARCRGLELAWPAASDLTVRVPAGVPVVVDAGAGAVRAEATSGDLRLRTGSGRIEVRDVTGRLDLHSGSGGVEVSGTRAAEVAVGTGSGDVEVRLSEAADRLGVRTGSGQVAVELPADGAPYAVRPETGSGDVTVGVVEDPAAARVVELRTGSGDITVRSAG